MELYFVRHGKTVWNQERRSVKNFKGRGAKILNNHKAEAQLKEKMVRKQGELKHDLADLRKNAIE